METIVGNVCKALADNVASEDTFIVFSQNVPDASTSVKIYTKPVDGKYVIQVTNDRTDTVFNSTPITEVFATDLPKLVGIFQAPVKNLPQILTNLILAKPYFGIRVYLQREGMFFLDAEQLGII